MKKLITIMIFFILVCNVQAERRMRGTVEKVDLEKGYIVINGMQYRLKEGKTKVNSGEYQMDLGMLTAGSKIEFVFDKALVTEITLTNPHEFKE
jgi:hypothetical protein